MKTNILTYKDHLGSKSEIKARKMIIYTTESVEIMQQFLSKRIKSSDHPMDGQAPFPSNQRPNPPGISGVWWGRLRQCLRRRRRIIFKPVNFAGALCECNLPLSCVKDCQPKCQGRHLQLCYKWTRSNTHTM